MSTFFKNSHDFTVGDLEISNVVGKYRDNSTTTVVNEYRGPQNHFAHHDHSYHDNSRHHRGHSYHETNHNYGATHKIGRVQNANFGTNYGSIDQSSGLAPSEYPYYPNNPSDNSYPYNFSPQQGPPGPGYYNGGPPYAPIDTGYDYGHDPQHQHEYGHAHSPPIDSSNPYYRPPANDGDKYRRQTVYPSAHRDRFSQHTDQTRTMRAVPAERKHGVQAVYHEEQIHSTRTTSNLGSTAVKSDARDRTRSTAGTRRANESTPDQHPSPPCTRNTVTDSYGTKALHHNLRALALIDGPNPGLVDLFEDLVLDDAGNSEGGRTKGNESEKGKGKKAKGKKREKNTPGIMQGLAPAAGMSRVFGLPPH